MAELSWQRTSKLRRVNAVTQEEADRDRIAVATLQGEVAAAKARLDLLQAPARADEVRMEQARVQAAKARLELAQVQLERTKLRAPCGAQVLKIDAEVGELTGPDSAEPVAILADTSTIRVRAFVEEMDAPRVQVGMPATVVTDGLPGVEFKGRVYRVSPRMSRKELWSDHPAERYDTKTRELWIELEQAQGLVVGLRVDVVIDTRPATPSTAPKTGGQTSPPAQEDDRAPASGDVQLGAKPVPTAEANPLGSEKRGQQRPADAPNNR